MSALTSYLRRHHVALLALFVALGGTSYAAVALPRGSVGKRQLRKNAVTGAKVKDGSLRSKDFRAGELPAGPQGIQGPAGMDGKDGKDGADAAPAATWLGGSFDPLEGASSGVRAPFGTGPYFYALAPAGTPMELSHLTVQVSAAPGAGHTRTLRLGVTPSFDQRIVCTIAGTAKGCDTGSETVLVPAGAQWSLYENADSPASANELTFSYLATPR
jgi:hypothetical protein